MNSELDVSDLAGKLYKKLKKPAIVNSEGLRRLAASNNQPTVEKASIVTLIAASI